MTENNTQKTAALPPSAYFDLRTNSGLPAGTCVYVQSGDPGDFDGRLLITVLGPFHMSNIDCDQSPRVVVKNFVRMHLPIVRGVPGTNLSDWKPK